jgi:hypothetical protein
MSKPVEIIHPITGQRCFTKHPERLLARCRIKEADGALIGLQPNEQYLPVIVGQTGWKTARARIAQGGPGKPSISFLRRG